MEWHGLSFSTGTTSVYLEKLSHGNPSLGTGTEATPGRYTVDPRSGVTGITDVVLTTGGAA